MKNRARATAGAALIAIMMLAGVAPASAHYDPWNTHWHYNAGGQATYKMCSWHDAVFFGCQNESRFPMPIVLR